MSPPDGSTTLTLNDTEAEESKMRAALGLTPGNTQPNRSAEQNRHKSGQGSEIPVIVSTRRSAEVSDTLRARLVAVTEELKAERSGHVATQQALADAQRTIQQVQTKLAHSEMAATEALDAERNARLAAEARLLAIVPVTPPEPTAEKSAKPKKRGRPPQQRLVVEEAEPDPEPVQWWLPSYKASQAKRVRPKS